MLDICELNEFFFFDWIPLNKLNTEDLKVWTQENILCLHGRYSYLTNSWFFFWKLEKAGKI